MGFAGGSTPWRIKDKMANEGIETSFTADDDTSRARGGCGELKRRVRGVGLGKTT